MIDYNIASETYDNTRSASEDLVLLFDRVVNFSSQTTVLDFGCGTGNYLDQIQSQHHSMCYGVEPSENMRAKAKRKNPNLIVKTGDHRRLPFPDSSFDFVYMTDVIHHVPDIPQMFREILRVLKVEARFCVVTESHAQIESRFYNRYFPSLAQKERQRYPDVSGIIREGEAAKLRLKTVEVKLAPAVCQVSESFIRTVREKNFSMFRLLDSEEHARGLSQLEGDLGTMRDTTGSGETLIWFEKGLLPG